MGVESRRGLGPYRLNTQRTMPSKKPTKEMEALKELLLNEAVGRRNAITIRDAGQRVGIWDGEGSVKTRVLRDDVMAFYQIPVCTTNAKPSGMYIPTSPTDVVDYQESLRGRAEGNLERAALIERVWAEWTGKVEQQTLTDG